MKSKSSFPNFEPDPMNRVLDAGFGPSKNFFSSDTILRDVLQKELNAGVWALMEAKLQKLGEVAATQMDELSKTADRNGPELKKRDYLGETVNEIVFHPAYRELLKIAVDHELFQVKWSPQSRENHKGYLHRMGFGLAFLYSMGDASVPCPLCMTDGAARLIDRYASEDDRARLLPHIFTDKSEGLFTGAMFLTEKSGGSDVGANLVTATHLVDDYYVLNGEKWFCSNANADIMLVLARANPEIKGTKGLSIFLVEKYKPDGEKNPMDVIRLKDKLGVRSMASAEILLTNTWGKRLGEEGEGFKIMTEMINLSRLWNAVVAMAGFRRCLIEAYQFLSHRHTFGKVALEHALVRAKLEALAARYNADFLLTWKTIRTLDEADQGNAESRALVRLLTPMVKKRTAESTVYGVRECMELMGGIGYIEDTVIPKFMRDVMVLPIWEGAGNIMVLDMLRASQKSDGLHMMETEIEEIFGKRQGFDGELKTLKHLMDLARELPQQERATAEMTAGFLFEELMTIYQLALLVAAEDEGNKHWIRPSILYYQKKLRKEPLGMVSPPSLEVVKAMLGLKF